MSMAELSESYRQSARLLRERLQMLRILHKQTDDPQVRWELSRRIADLEPMLTQVNELAELTAHYYDRGYWRSEKYTV